MDDFDPNAVRVEQALAYINTNITPLSQLTRVAVRDSLWRVLGEDAVSAIDVPNHDNAAMDGYALRFDDLKPGDAQSLTTQLAVKGVALAGRRFEGRIEAGECVRIMTGAVMPTNADTVIMQEDVDTIDARGIRVGDGRRGRRYRRGQFVRRRADDVAAGVRVLEQGKRVTPADVGLLATCGIGEVNVVRRPRIAFMSTGDELRSIGEPLNTGDVYDSNRYSLHAMLSRLGADIIDMGVIADDADAVRGAFRDAAASADAVIVSGGASVGEADYVHQTLTELGEVNFWKIAMKPGRPLAFGAIDNALFFGLPGNPVSVIVTFYQFVTPALKRLMGMRETEPVRLRATLAAPIKKQPGRTEFQRGIMQADERGDIHVTATGAQGSHILTSMSHANCFIVLPLECGDLDAGAPVAIEPFEGLL